MIMKSESESKLVKFGFGVCCVGVFIILCLAVWRMAWVTMVDNYEMAFCYNRWTGKIEIIDRTGWIIRAPIINSVHTIDLRPYQITIVANIGGTVSGRSLSARILNAKLVRFNPKGLTTFIEWHGRSGGDNLENMLETLKAYAFAKDGGQSCPFLTTISEVAPNQIGQSTTGHQVEVK